LDAGDTVDSGARASLLASLRASERLEPRPSAWRVRVRITLGASATEFASVRVVRVRARQRYRGSVHEYLVCAGAIADADAVVHHDRARDAHKTMARMTRDVVLLERDVVSDPADTRALFYLARTHDSLGNRAQAYDAFLRRVAFRAVFPEEVYESCLALARLCEAVGRPESRPFWLIEAYRAYPRIEALVELARCIGGERHAFTGHLMEFVCRQEVPADSRLFVNRNVYEKERFIYWRSLTEPRESK
jgi:hypothetical protein